jgi:PPOX class probable F420-dependent enzyme
VARLATTDPDGRPHLVPIVFAVDGDTLYSAVDRKPKRSRTLRRIENARARPDVTILVDQYEEDCALSGGFASAAARAFLTSARNGNARSRY